MTTDLRQIPEVGQSHRLGKNMLNAHDRRFKWTWLLPVCQDAKLQSQDATDFRGKVCFDEGLPSQASSQQVVQRGFRMDDAERDLQRDSLGVGASGKLGGILCGFFGDFMDGTKCTHNVFLKGLKGGP